MSWGMWLGLAVGVAILLCLLVPVVEYCARHRGGEPEPSPAAREVIEEIDESEGE